MPACVAHCVRRAFIVVADAVHAGDEGDGRRWRVAIWMAPDRMIAVAGFGNDRSAGLSVRVVFAV